MILILRLYTIILLTYLPIPTARHHRSQWTYGDQFHIGITRLVTQYETGSGLFSWLILMDHSVEGYGNSIYNIFVMKINYTCVSVACVRGYKLYSNFLWERVLTFDISYHSVRIKSSNSWLIVCSSSYIRRTVWVVWFYCLAEIEQTELQTSVYSKLEFIK